MKFDDGNNVETFNPIKVADAILKGGHLFSEKIKWPEKLDII